MTLCLYECLRTVGLQHHYASFTSVGIFRAAHLSALTMEDYPILGVRSMEERTRLFHLVQMVKTLDLEYDDNGDDVSDADAVQEGCTVANSFSHDGCGDPDEYEYDYEDDQDATSLSKPSCVRRRLDFNCEPIDYNPKQFSHPEGTVHIYTSHNKNNVPCQGRESSKHVQLDTEGAVVCGYQEKNNHKPDVHQSESHTGSNTVPNAIKGNSKNNSHTRLWPENISFHKPKPRPAPLASNRIINKSAVHNDRKGFSRKGKLYTDIGSNRVVAEMAQPTPVYESKRTAGYNYGLPLSSPPALNKRQPGGQRISVCVRKRPLTRTESRRGEANVVTTPSGECVIVHESKEAVDLTQYILQHKFYFDQVFGEESSNDEVYRRTAYPLVQHMLSGGKATCFAYGQTGAGKTYTMLGSPVRPGLYALAVQDIFAHLSTTHLHSPLLVYVSFFEIYCGQLYDLLDHRKRLFAREDGHKVVHIAGLRNVKVDSVGSVLEVISRGTEERTQGVSGANSLSSRSHALLQIQLRDTNQQIAGRMWFVDLAGSERASDTRDPDKQSRMEGAEINQSLLALKECIRSLDQEQSHTPFRQSKLTQVLKDSFVGDSMTCMIANISPGHLAAEHTLNTLRYADRVKELRGQGGLRGGRRGKTTSSPKRNLSNSSSNSVGGNNAGARGKSPPKKPKLGRQREDNSPTTRLAPFLCSTPKTGRSGEDTSARKGIGLEHLTPVRGLLGCGDKKERWERAGGREGRNRERYGERDQRCEAGLFLEQATDEQINLCRVQRESGLCHREKEIQQISLKGGEEEEEGRRVEPGRGEGSSRYTCSEVDRLSERDVIKLDERDKERKRHLRQYHQQLQQFMPSSASSSVQLFSPSSSYPHQASLSSSDAPSSCSSLPHSSSFSLSALMNHGIEEVLDAYGASVEVRANSNRGQLAFFPSQGISLQTEISPRFFKNENENIGGDSVDGQDLGVSREGTEARCGHDRGTHTQRSSLKVSGEGQVRREEWRTAGMEGGGGRRWVWLEKTQTEQADRMKVERLAESEALVSYNCDSKERGEVGDGGLDASDLRADAVWSNEEQEGADSYSLLSTHSAITSNDVANCPSVESSHQRAPAERPLSPACGHTSTLLTPNKHSNLSPKLKHNRCTSNILSQQMQNARQGVPSSSCREHQQLFAVHANRREISNTQSATLPLTSPTTQNGCEIPAQPLKMSLERSAYPVVHKQTEVKAKMSASLCQDASDSQSYIMDPLSISLLQVDQQVATSSFLEGQQDSTSLYSLENERGREVEKECLTSGQDVGDEDVEFRLSLLELPQGVMKRPIPGVMQVSLQDQENNQKPQTKPAIDILVNKSPAFPLNPSTFAFMQTSDMQSISSSAQQSGNTDSPSSHNLTSKQAPQKPPQKHAFSISTPQSESGLCQLNTMPKQCHTAHLYHSSNISLLTKGPTESNGKERTSKQQVRPMTHLPMLEDLDHDRWRVVQAHWEQLEEMEALHRKEGTLLCQQPDMKFGEYVHKLENIMERKAWCVNNMIAQLQPYLKPGHSNQPHNQEGDNNNTVA